MIFPLPVLFQAHVYEMKQAESVMQRQTDELIDKLEVTLEARAGEEIERTRHKRKANRWMNILCFFEEKIVKK